MPRKQETIVVSEDDVRETIANSDLSRFIELLAELIAEERIREITESKNREAGGPSEQ